LRAVIAVGLRGTAVRVVAHRADDRQPHIRPQEGSLARWIGATLRAQCNICRSNSFMASSISGT
jgi:hypothetical protein